MKNTNFEMRRKSDDIYSIKIQGEIGDLFDDWLFDGNTTDTSFRDRLNEIPSDVTTLEVAINTPGGSVTQGVSIYNQLRESGYNIRTYILGEASSIGSIIFLAGDERIMPEGTFSLIHQPSHLVYQNIREARINLQHLEAVNASMKEIYLNHLSISEDELDEMMESETILTPSKAIEIGFATSKTLPSGVKTTESSDTTAIRAERTKEFLQNQEKEILAKLNNFNNEVDMSKKDEITIDIEALVKEKALLEGKLEAAEKMKAQVEKDFTNYKAKHEEVDIEKIKAEAKAEAISEMKDFQEVKAKATAAKFQSDEVNNATTSEELMRAVVNEFGMNASSFKDVDAITEMFNYVIKNKPSDDTDSDYEAFVNVKDESDKVVDTNSNPWAALNEKNRAKRGGK